MHIQASPREETLPVKCCIVIRMLYFAIVVITESVDSVSRDGLDVI